MTIHNQQGSLTLDLTAPLSSSGSSLSCLIQRRRVVRLQLEVGVRKDVLSPEVIRESVPAELALPAMRTRPNRTLLQQVFEVLLFFDGARISFIEKCPGFLVTFRVRAMAVVVEMGCLTYRQ